MMESRSGGEDAFEQMPRLSYDEVAASARGASEGTFGETTGATSAEITVPHVPSGETSGAAAQEVSAESTGTVDPTIIAVTALRTAADAEARRTAGVEHVDAIDRQVEALGIERTAAMQGVRSAAAERKGILDRARTEAWEAMPKAAEGYAYGPESVRAAVELSPHNGTWEPEDVRAARVQAAEDMGQKVQTGVPAVVTARRSSADYIYFGAVPEHDGLSVGRTHEGPFTIGINGYGLTIGSAWQVERHDNAVDMKDRIKVWPNFDVLTGDAAVQKIVGTYTESVDAAARLTKFIEAPRPAGMGDEVDPAVRQSMLERGYYMDDVVRALEAAKAIGLPVTDEQREMLTAPLYRHMQQMHDTAGVDRSLQALRVGIATRHLYPEGDEGNAAMLQDLIKVGRQQHDHNSGVFATRAIPRVAAMVCNADFLETIRQIHAKK